MHGYSPVYLQGPISKVYTITKRIAREIGKIGVGEGVGGKKG